MDGPVDGFEEFARGLLSMLEQAGVTVTAEEVKDLLWEAGLGDVLQDLEVARSVIRAADGFHPVARFFAPGSQEREFIVRMLRETP